MIHTPREIETDDITDSLCKLGWQLRIFIGLSHVTTPCLGKRMVSMYCLLKWNFYVKEYEKFRSKFQKLEFISENLSLTDRY